MKYLKNCVRKLKNYFRKRRFNVAVIYATLIVNGKKTFADVPKLIKEKVRQVLIDLDLEELTQE